jgi:hypothetical protein
LIFILDVADSDRLTDGAINGAEDADVDGAVQYVALADVGRGMFIGSEVAHVDDVPPLTKRIIFNDLTCGASILLDDRIAGATQEDPLARLSLWLSRHGVFSRVAGRGPAGQN